jgi:hypothetical protein
MFMYTPTKHKLLSKLYIVKPSWFGTAQSSYTRFAKAINKLRPFPRPHHHRNQTYLSARTSVVSEIIDAWGPVPPSAKVLILYWDLMVTCRNYLKTSFIVEALKYYNILIECFRAVSPSVCDTEQYSCQWFSAKHINDI